MENDVPSHVQLMDDKAKWDTEQKQKQQETIKSGKIIIGKIDVPFTDMIVLLVKISFAAIPVAIIVMITWAVLISFFGNLLR